MGKVVITIEYEDAKHPAGQPPRVGHPPIPNLPIPNFQQGQHINVDPKIVGELMKQFGPMFNAMANQPKPEEKPKS